MVDVPHNRHTGHAAAMNQVVLVDRDARRQGEGRPLLSVLIIFIVVANPSADAAHSRPNPPPRVAPSRRVVLRHRGKTPILSIKCFTTSAPLFSSSANADGIGSSGTMTGL